MVEYDTSLTITSSNFRRYTQLISEFEPYMRIKLIWRTYRDIPSLKYNIIHLDCSSSGLQNLPKLPESLIILDCFDNNFTKLPNLPPDLEILDCSRNNLSQILSLPSSLLNLNCSENEIFELPDILPKLIELRCDSNKLDSLPNLPEDSLEVLVCSDNQLEVLPDNLSNCRRLRSLNCSDNQLTFLPDLPDSLTFLNCQSNRIAVFPVFPENLTQRLLGSQQLSSELEGSTEESSDSSVEDFEWEQAPSEDEEENEPNIIPSFSEESGDEEKGRFGFKIDRVCNTSTDLISGDSLESYQQIVIIIIDGRAFCYTHSDLLNTWRSASQVYEWSTDEDVDDRKLSDRPLYGLIYLSGYLNKKTKDLILSGHDTILIDKEENLPVGSEFGVSRLHGEIRTIYSGRAISRVEFLNSLKEEDRS